MFESLVYNLFSFFSFFLQSRFQEKITKLAKTETTTLLYAADQLGYIYSYDIQKFAPSQRSHKGEFVLFCRSIILKMNHFCKEKGVAAKAHV